MFSLFFNLFLFSDKSTKSYKFLSMIQVIFAHPFLIALVQIPLKHFLFCLNHVFNIFHIFPFSFFDLLILLISGKCV